MADGDFKMPKTDLPVTREFPKAEKARGFRLWKSSSDAEETARTSGAPLGSAPEDQPLPPEETAPGAYIYTSDKKRSFKSFRKKILSMYAAGGLAVLLLTNIIPLYHTKNDTLPSGNLRILSVLTAFAGWQDEEGHTLIFKENGTGYTWQETGFFGQIRYTGGEEGVDAVLNWTSIDGGHGSVSDPERFVINNDNLKEDGNSYTLEGTPGSNPSNVFRPVNFLSLNTKYIEDYMRYGIRGLLPDTEWFSRRGGEEPLEPGMVYTSTVRLGAADQAYEETRGISAEGLLEVWSESSAVPGYKLDPADQSYRISLKEGVEDAFEHTFFFHIDLAQDTLWAHLYNDLGEAQLLTEARDHFDGVVLVAEDGYVLSWDTPFSGWRSYAPVTPVLPPDERDTPLNPDQNPDETEEPTEEPRDVRATLTECAAWVSEDGVWYAFHEDGTGWVFSEGYFGTMRFEGDETSVDLSTVLNAEDLSYSDEKEELISSITKHEFYHTVTPDAFSEEDGVLTVLLGKPDSFEDAVFRQTEELPDTSALDLFLEKGLAELNRTGYWFIVDEYVPESMYPMPYTEFISFDSETSLYFVFNTTEPVTFTSDYSFEVPCSMVDPITFEYSMEKDMEISYVPIDQSGGYSTYTHTQQPKDGYIRLIIKEDGLYVYADVPMGRPNLYRYLEN